MRLLEESEQKIAELAECFEGWKQPDYDRFVEHVVKTGRGREVLAPLVRAFARVKAAEAVHRKNTALGERHTRRLD